MAFRRKRSTSARRFRKRRRTVAYRRRRNFRRRESRMKSRSLIRRGLVGMPPSINMKMRWARNEFGSIAASGTNLYSIGSSIWDVAAWLGGQQQPMYFDQMATMYDRWFVWGFRYSISFYNTNNAAADTPLVVNLQIRTDQTIDNDPNIASQRWYDKRRTWGHGRHRLTGYVPVGQAHGLYSKRCYNDPEFWGTTSSNPARMSFMNLQIQNPWLVATAFHMELEITYDVHWFRLVNVAGS